MAMPKAALLRAVSDDIPLPLIETIAAEYIPITEIEIVAHNAITGREDGEGDSTTFAGINRFVAFGGNRPFIDPAGTLVQGARDYIRALRRARGADPAGMKKRPGVHKPQTMPAQPRGV